MLDHQRVLNQKCSYRHNQNKETHKVASYFMGQLRSIEMVWGIHEMSMTQCRYQPINIEIQPIPSH